MPAPTIADVDKRLIEAHLAYCQAIDEGKLALADLAYAQMDLLLDTRLRLPQQRPS